MTMVRIAAGWRSFGVRTGIVSAGGSAEKKKNERTMKTKMKVEDEGEATTNEVKVRCLSREIKRVESYVVFLKSINNPSYFFSW